MASTVGWLAGVAPVGVVSLLLLLPKRENFFFPFELD
jgi:hypothetical protein